MQKEGVSALFAGVGAKGVHSWTSSFLYFLAFSSLKRSWEARTGKKIGMGANLVVAALAGCCNVLLTEPLDTLSTRRQIAGTRGNGGDDGDGDGDGDESAGGKAAGGAGEGNGSTGGRVAVEDTSLAGSISPPPLPPARSLSKKKQKRKKPRSTAFIRSI